MKFFATTVALAAAATAEADPQFLVNTPVVSSPLLKTLGAPVTYAAKPVVTYNQVPVATTQYVAPTQYIASPQYVAHTQYLAPKPVEAVEKVEKVEEQKVVSYAQPLAYAQPALTYTHQPVTYTHQQVAYAQPAVTYTKPVAYASPVAYTAPLAYPKPAKYIAKNGEVEHIVTKREAEAEPIDYVNVQTGLRSSISYPTLEKTLRAYNKYPAYTAPAVYNAAPVAYNAAPVAYNTAYNGQYAVPQVYANQYQYAYPTVF